MNDIDNQVCVYCAIGLNVSGYIEDNFTGGFKTKLGANFEVNILEPILVTFLARQLQL
jgi:hypothetical protein